MTNIPTHTDNAAPVIFTVVSIIYSAYNATLIVIFLCAVFGAGIGLAFRPAPAEAKSKVELALRFAGNAGFILVTAIVITVLSHWLNKWFADAIYPVSFMAALVLMVYRELIVALGAKVITRKSEGL